MRKRSAVGTGHADGRRPSWSGPRILAQRKVSQNPNRRRGCKVQTRHRAGGNLKATIDRKNIRAPFDGVLGIRQVNVGQFVNVGQSIVPLQSFDVSIWTLPCRSSGSPTVVGLTVHVTSDVFRNQFTGKSDRDHPSVDVATRNVSVQATLENPEHLLKPGMFARVEVPWPPINLFSPFRKPRSYAPYGDSVYVSKKEGPEDGKKDALITPAFVSSGRPAAISSRSPTD